ncbi:MAG: hypothetical protein M1832_003003 [Thelocarpon impressellum]|nr:MAG: hypothetical protein M1832_003003 [Thelocarpon impressellum]
MASEFSSAHVVQPLTAPAHTMILLHGRGSSGREFAEELAESRTSPQKSLAECLPSYKWIFPSSRARFSTVFKEPLDAWFDIHSLEDPASKEELQVEGLRESVGHVRAIVDEEVRRVGAERVVLGGMSMGCATALHVLLSCPYRLGGFVGLRGWMPFRAQLEAVAAASELPGLYKKTLDLDVAPSSTALATPVFLGSAVDDEIVDVALGQQIHRALLHLGVRVVYREYADGGHWIKDPDEVDDVVAFVQAEVGE